MVTANIDAVAKACEVSKATVSRVFAGKSGVGEAVRRRVIETARALNYAPKQTAAQQDVAIVVSHYEGLFRAYTFFTNILARLFAVFYREGVSFRLVDESQAELLLPGYAKVALLFLEERPAAAAVAKLAAAKIPAVCVNQVVAGAYAVCSDHAQGAALAVERLLQAGHRKIGLLLDAPSWGSRERLRGYRETLARHGVEPLPEQALREGRSVVEGLAAIRAQGATALLLEGESILEESVSMLNLLKVAVPDDMSVISCEKERVSQWLNPPHTTVSQNPDDLCAAVLKLVQDLAAGKRPAAKLTMLPSALVERSSVKFLQNGGSK